KLTSSDGAAGDSFGVTVALLGNTALIGSPNSAISGQTKQGAAYLYQRSGSTWAEQTKLIADDGAASDQFGARVAVSADTALVGAIQADAGGTADRGA